MFVQPDSDTLRQQTHCVHTQMKYLLPGCPKNRRFVCAGEEMNTGEYADYPVDVYDARPLADRFDLDNQGFVLAPHISAVKNFDDFDEINAIYEAEACEQIKRMTGADLVLPQGWMIRTPEPPKRTVENYVHKGGIQPPAGEVHIDYNPQFADMMSEGFLRSHQPDAPPIKRFIATSFWRCISEPPQDWPLAVCDARSVPWQDGETNTLVVCDKIPVTDEEKYRPIDGEEQFPAAAIFHFNEDHRWWFFSEMNRDEVLLLKFHDSLESVARRVPHTAFHNPLTQATHARRSIELRSVAYFF